MTPAAPSTHIKYKDGYKYQLQEDAVFHTGIYISDTIVTDYVLMYRGGLVIVRKGYCWDGPSGPTIDTKSSMRGSLVHDALYQLMRLGLLPESRRDDADSFAEQIWHEDGMLCIRHNLWDKMLHLFGKNNAKKGTERKVLTAP